MGEEGEWGGSCCCCFTLELKSVVILIKLHSKCKILSLIGAKQS